MKRKNQSELISSIPILHRLAQSQIEEFIVKENFHGSENNFLTFDEFIQRLKIPADNISYTLFKLFTSKSDDVVIDFKEYLFHALFTCKLAEPHIELVKLLFILHGDCERIDREVFVRIMKHFLPLKTENLNNFFYQLDRKKLGLIAFKDFYDATNDRDLRFKTLYEANKNFRQKQDSQ